MQPLRELRARDRRRAREGRGGARELDRLGDGRAPLIANRARIAASLGGAGWAGLEPGAHYLFTVESARRLVAIRDQVVAGRRWAPGAGIAAIWQTILNTSPSGATSPSARSGRRGGPGGRALAAPDRRPVSVVLAIPAMVIALPVELAGAHPPGRSIDLRLQLL